MSTPAVPPMTAPMMRAAPPTTISATLRPAPRFLSAAIGFAAAVLLALIPATLAATVGPVVDRAGAFEADEAAGACAIAIAAGEAIPSATIAMTETILRFKLFSCVQRCSRKISDDAVASNPEVHSPRHTHDY